MTRELASWAERPSTSSDRLLHNPFGGFGADLRQVGRYWRWGRGSHRPVSLLRLAPEQLGERPGGIRQRLRDPFVGLLRWARVEVTGLTPSSEQRVAVAHVETPADLAVLLESVPKHWRAVTGKAPGSLPTGRSLLFATDFASAGADEVVQAAAALATRAGVPLLPMVVRRLTSGLPADDESRTPRPKRIDEVLVRYADPVTGTDASAAAQVAQERVGDLIAEDDATWWQVATGAVESPLVRPMPSWRRQWERTDPTRNAGRSRRQIWR